MTAAAQTQMKRPTGWLANPQAMAAATQRLRYSGSPGLGAEVDVDTWLTPRYILLQLGVFDLDPCAALVNPHWVCQRSFTVEQDGLSQPWVGRVFMNPPFSQSARWLTRHAEYGRGISLVAASVESKVWREAVWKKAEAVFCFTVERASVIRTAPAHRVARCDQSH